MGFDRGQIGAPTSSTGEGIAHLGGRFDVKRKAAGDGLGALDGEVARRLSVCKSLEDALSIGVTKEVAEAHFNVRGRVDSLLGDRRR